MSGGCSGKYSHARPEPKTPFLSFCVADGRILQLKTECVMSAADRKAFRLNHASDTQQSPLVTQHRYAAESGFTNG